MTISSIRTAITASVLLLVDTLSPAFAEVEREDFYVSSDPDVEIFVRRVSNGPGRTARALLLLHGTRVPGVASFDLPVENGSLAADLARAGHTVYLMDARGYGASTRPPAMSAAPEANAPLVRAGEVARDVDAVVKAMLQREGPARVALLGWATGGQWLGFYASLHPDKVSHLVLYNSLYGGVPEHPSLGLGSDYEDPERPGRFNRNTFGAYRFNTAASLLPSWDESIPEADKSRWRDPAVLGAYTAAALQSDPTSSTRQPASFRAPTGALEDSFYLATGRQLWDASLLRADTLVIHSGRDFWSRPEDARLLAEHAAHAAVRTVNLPDATHYVHLDRPESGRNEFLRHVTSFLAE